MSSRPPPARTTPGLATCGTPAPSPSSVVWRWLFAALTGFWDSWKSSEAGTQARRTINTHATIMVTVTVLALADLGWRLNDHHTEPVTPIGIVILSVLIAVLVSVGATFGGTLVFDYGFNVETAGDHPAWHKSETDVFPGEHDTEVPS